MFISVDDVEAAIFAETFRHDDTLGGLIIFEDCSHDAGQSECRAVEGVAEVGLLVAATIAAFQSVGLVAFEVGYRRHFEPSLLSGTPHFEVEGDGGSETHIAATETQDMPRKSKLIEQSLHMVFHLFECSVGIFRLLDAHDLYLVELMETVQASHILAITAGFATPTG